MRFLLYCLILIVSFSCSLSEQKDLQLIDYTPKNSQILIKTSDLEFLKNGLKTNGFLKYFIKNQSLGIPPLEFLNPKGNVFISASYSENDSLHHTLVTKFTPSVFITDSLQNYSEELLKYKSYTIKKSVLDTETFYHSVLDSTFILSTSEDIVRNLFTKESNNTNLQSLYAVADKDQNLSILANTEYPNFPFLFINDRLTSKSLTDDFVLDIELLENDIFFNGVAKSRDTTLKALDVFKNTIPQEHQTQHITPGNSDGFFCFTFDDFETFQSGIKQVFKVDSISNSSKIFDNVIEVGIIYQEDAKAISLYSIDVIATQDALLSENQTIESYRGIDIIDFSKKDIFTNTLSPFITEIKPSKYCILDNFFVFSEDIDFLQNTIANYQNKTTLSTRPYYTYLDTKLSSESSLLMVYKPELLEKILSKNDNCSEIDGYNLSAFQFIYDSNYTHLHGGIVKSKTKITTNVVNEELNITFDDDLLSNPQFVTNHITKQKEIVVQDIGNVLYLISKQGKILWKKRLTGPILGKIEQIDIYKNGRLQLAFATQNRVYVLDRKGRDVSPFPLRFNDEITQPLSVFDYDKNKNYRFMVTQGRHVLLYDAKGKTVKGFNFKSAENTIISQPKHFRIGSKDYLVLKTKDKLHILNRKGSLRVKPKKQYKYSKEPIFVYQNKFTTTLDDGKLVSIDSRGNTSTIDLGLSQNHNLITTSKTRVTLNENKLGIKSKVLDLDFGNYSNPTIFYINDKIYVSVTDLQSKKVYLFDSQGNMQPNFPVYGNSAMDLDNIDGDKNLEFVVKGDPNSILLYQIN